MHFKSILSSKHVFNNIKIIHLGESLLVFGNVYLTICLLCLKTIQKCKIFSLKICFVYDWLTINNFQISSLKNLVYLLLGQVSFGQTNLHLSETGISSKWLKK